MNLLAPGCKDSQIINKCVYLVLDIDMNGPKYILVNHQPPENKFFKLIRYNKARTVTYYYLGVFTNIFRQKVPGEAGSSLNIWPGTGEPF